VIISLRLMGVTLVGIAFYWFWVADYSSVENATRGLISLIIGVGLLYLAEHLSGWQSWGSEEPYDRDP
jgi:hypothetical protein